MFQQPFKPPSIFFANRKANAMWGVLKGAGVPLAKDRCRETVALAWGWVSWAEMAEATAELGTPSPLDAELVGPCARRGPMDHGNARVVAFRGKRSVEALLTTTGLPTDLCYRLAAAIRFTDTHKHPGDDRAAPSDGTGPLAEAGFASESDIRAAAAAAVRSALSGRAEHTHGAMREFAISLADSIAGRSPSGTGIPPLPAYRPR